MNTVPNIRYNTKHEAIVDAENRGATITKLGETQREISTEAGKVVLNDSGQQISKCDSEMIRFLFWGLRLFGVFIAGLVIAKVFGIV